MATVRFKSLTLLIVLLQLYNVIGYKNYIVESTDICGLRKKTITLGDNGTLGVIVGQTRVSDHPIDWKEPFICKFQIRNKRNFITRIRNDPTDGIVAVIQYLSLRQDKDTGDCIDYIQFTSEHTNRRFCGKITATNTTDTTTNILHGTVIEQSGQLDTKIVIDRRKPEPDEVADFKIVYTSYKLCWKDDNYLPCNNDICIHKQFFNDTYVNCPLTNCVDESGCKVTKTKFSTGIGTKIAIGAISTVVLGFILFLMCLWICRKHAFLCWSTTCTGDAELPSANIEFNSNRGGDSPSAPQSETAALSTRPPSHTVSKDLPPSYDSLFPGR